MAPVSMESNEYYEETDINFMDIASAFNVGYAERIIKSENLAEKLEEAIGHDGPAMIEVFVEQDNPDSGAVSTGKWDLADLENKYRRTR